MWVTMAHLKGVTGVSRKMIIASSCWLRSPLSMAACTLTNACAARLHAQHSHRCPTPEAAGMLAGIRRVFASAGCNELRKQKRAMQHHSIAQEQVVKADNCAAGLRSKPTWRHAASSPPPSSFLKKSRPPPVRRAMLKAMRAARLVPANISAAP